MFVKLLAFLAVLHAQTNHVWADGCIPCVNIDAALTMHGKVYLIHKDEAITLNSEHEEDAHFKTDEKWPGFPAHVDAAFVWPAAHNTPYFFHDSVTHVFTNGKLEQKTYPSSDWSSFVARGLDAVAFAEYYAIFAKGCYYQKRHKNSYTHSRAIIDLRGVNLPCDLDAALTIDNKMIAIKGDKYWSWDGIAHATGPHDLSDVIKIHSWTLCPANL